MLTPLTDVWTSGPPVTSARVATAGPPQDPAPPADVEAEYERPQFLPRGMPDMQQLCIITATIAGVLLFTHVDRLQSRIRCMERRIQTLECPWPS